MINPLHCFFFFVSFCLLSSLVVTKTEKEMVNSFVIISFFCTVAFYAAFQLLIYSDVAFQLHSGSLRNGGFLFTDYQLIRL